MRTALFAAILFLLAGNASAQEYLIRENPDELMHFVSTDRDCPFTGNELETTVEGVMIRSRIKPAPYILPVLSGVHENLLFLSILVSCAASKTASC